MYKKDYIAWEISNEFPMEELRSKFKRMLPFTLNNSATNDRASNQLFWLTTENAKANRLVGVRGIPSIRHEMSMNELLYDILVVASSITLIATDINYYARAVPSYSKRLDISFITSMIRGMDLPAITWVRDNIYHPTQLTCRVFSQ